MLRTIARMFTIAGCMLAASSVLAGPSAALPPIDGKPNTLKIRLVRYAGGTNGGMLVDVRNVGKRPQHFVAQGLFFVPNGNPDGAPQRVGAAGPFEVWRGRSWQLREGLAIAPGKTERLRLQVFCLDSHRASPGGGQGFHVGRKRLSKQLRQKIKSGADKATTKNKGARGKANSEIQGHIWRTRDSKWIEIEGEGKQEKRRQ